MKIKYKVPLGTLHLPRRSDLAEVRRVLDEWITATTNEKLSYNKDYDRPVFLSTGKVPKGMDSAGHATAEDMGKAKRSLLDRFRLYLPFRQQSSTRYMFFCFASRKNLEIEYALKEVLYPMALDAKLIDILDLFFMRVMFFSIRPVRVVFDLSDYHIGVLQPSIVNTGVKSKERDGVVIRTYRPVYNERTGKVGMESIYHTQAEEFHDTIMTRWDTH